MCIGDALVVLAEQIIDFGERRLIGGGDFCAFDAQIGGLCLPFFDQRFVGSVDVTVGAADIAGQNIPQMFVVEGFGVDAEGFENIVPQPRVFEDVIHMADRVDDDVVIPRFLLQFVVSLFVCIVIGGNQSVLLGLRLNRFFRFDSAEIKRRRKVAVAGVLQLVGETVRVVEIAFQHLLHEGGGIGHLAQAIGLHGVGI